MPVVFEEEGEQIEQSERKDTIETTQPVFVRLMTKFTSVDQKAAKYVLIGVSLIFFGISAILLTLAIIS